MELDVVPLDICGIILGRPYLYDRKTIFHRHENKYHLFKGGVEYIVRAHNKKTNLSLVNAGKMKRLVNSSNNFMLLMIKPRNDIDYEAFDGCNSNLKSNLVDVVNEFDEMFHESKGLIHKRGIEPKLQLQQKCLLPNIRMYRMSVMESIEIKTQIQGLLNKRIIRPTPLLCGAPLVLVPEKSGKHFLEWD